MSNKTYIPDRIAWLEWLEANCLDRDQTVSPEKFPCVAVRPSQTMVGTTFTLSAAEALFSEEERRQLSFPMECDLVVTSTEYVYLTDFLPF